MFIERSAGRIRLVRTLFVLLAVAPCAGLCGWAALRHSSGYRAAIERRCERLIGLPVSVGSVEHVRPDAMRLRGCRLSSASGGTLLVVPVIEVESLPHEIRLSLPRLACTPELAVELAALAGAWLRQPVRFPVNCVVDIDDFSWRLGAAGAEPGPAAADLRADRGLPTGDGPLHVECVAANGSRAVRVRRNDGTGSVSDEVRLVTTPRGVGGSDDRDGVDDRAAPGGLELLCSLSEPLPIAVIEAVSGAEPGGLPLGAEAVVTGTATASFGEGGWSGSAALRIDRVDLATAGRQLSQRMTGEAAVAIDRVAWSRGRVLEADCRCSVARGRLSQRFLDACVTLLGCRPGPAYRSLARDEVRQFDDLEFTLRIDADGTEIRAAAGRAGALAKVQGLSIVDEPPAPVSLDRLAWLVAPPGAVAVPASRATAWLLGAFPVDLQAGGPTGMRSAPDSRADSTPPPQPEQAGRPQRRSEF